MEEKREAAAIRCRGLKVYRDYFVPSRNLWGGEIGQFCLSDVDLDVKKGCITGLIGRNGAGKSTLILALAGHLVWEAGTVEYDGLTWERNSREIRRKVAFVFDHTVLPERRTGRQIAEQAAAVEPWFDWEGFHRNMERMELRETMPVRHYSAGMKKIFSLILMLSRRPETLVLDEPTTGVDPISRREMLDLMQEFMEEENHSILFSTHITGDLDRIADEVAMVSGGRILFREEKEALKQKMASPDGTLPEIEEIMEHVAREGWR